MLLTRDSKPLTRMSFWSENYSFIKDVYDTRVCKMVEWMDHVEMAITKVDHLCHQQSSISLAGDGHQGVHQR